MKKTFKLLTGAILFTISLSASAALQCSDMQCDVKWKTNMGEIDLSSVCHNYKATPQYKECRNLASKVFAQRCDRAKQNDNPVWKEIYCDNAMKKYKP